jgi:hypothetical protein
VRPQPEISNFSPLVAEEPADSKLARILNGDWSKPITPKEFAAVINRSAEWVCEQIRAGVIATCPPHRRPYQIPRRVLIDFVEGRS